jgi:arylsulfatase A-like enzyme
MKNNIIKSSDGAGSCACLKTVLKVFRFAKCDMGRLSILFLSVSIGLSSLEAQDTKPNILFIMTDDQHAGMLSATGNPSLKTPNMDRLAAEGVRFERAYTANPVCSPARFSIFTGMMPSVIGQEAIVFKPTAPLPKVTLGAIFRNAGYRTAFGGKRHLPGWGNSALDEREGKLKVIAESVNYGFDELLTEDCRDKLTQACVRYFRQDHEKPFLLVASYINPHDICYMAIQAYNDRKSGSGIRKFFEKYLDVRLPEGEDLNTFIEANCPPLPANWEIPANEPAGILELDPRPFRAYVRANWTEKEWRLYRWAYARLTERGDTQIGELLEGLRESGLSDNTLVVFTSDHGSMDAAHRLEHKSMPYEEAIRVPFIFNGKGVTKAGFVDRKHLVSNGLDLIPTLCDFAGVPVPTELTGRSLRPLIEGQSPHDWRQSLVVENERARFLHLGDKKYGVIASGAGRQEMFYDLSKDPGEMKNVVSDASYKDDVANARRQLLQWYAEHGLVLDPKYIVDAEAPATMQ